MSHFNLRIKSVVSVVCVMLIFFYLQINPKLSEIQLLKKTQRSLSSAEEKKNLRRVPSSYEIELDHRNDVIILNELVQMIEAQELAIQSIASLKNKSIYGLKQMTFNIVMEGEMLQFEKLCMLFSRHSRLIRVNDLILAGRRIEMQVSVFNVHTKPRQDISLEQHRYVGFIHEGKTIEGILRLPDGATILVREGSIVGKQTQVQSISEKEMVIKIGSQLRRLSYLI